MVLGDMKLINKCVLAVVGAVCLSNCASTQQFVPLPDQSVKVEDPSKGRIYVMRPTSFGAAISMGVSDDGRQIGSTGPKGYLCWETAPGKSVISSKAESTSAVNVAVRPGEVTYVFQHIRMGLVMARNSMEIVDAAEGAKVLKSCKAPKVIR